MYAAPDGVLVVFLLIPVLGGVLSFAASDNTPSAVAWRRSLVKSRLSPGTPITTIIWVVLYLCMGTSSFLVYSATTSAVLSAPAVAYLTQLLLNHFFIIVLFGLQRVDLALLMMLPLWLATALTAALFYEVDALAGWLMTPVFSWVSFSVYLNTVLYCCNPVYTDVSFAAREEALASKRKTA